jgi:hypothetical protein
MNFYKDPDGVVHSRIILIRNNDSYPDGWYVLDDGGDLCGPFGTIEEAKEEIALQGLDELL